LKGKTLKKILIYILFIGSFLSAQNNKINIAVLDLDATNIKEEDAKFLSDRLRIELFDAGTFNVLERDKMNAILDEQGFQMSGCNSVECAVEIGQLLNVRQMVAGNIGRIGNVYSITLRLISVETGELMKTAKHDYQGELSEMLTEVLPEIARELSRIEGAAVEAVKDTKPKKVNDRWGIQIKFGSAISAIVTDFNNRIDEFNATFQPDLDNLSQFRSVALIVVWDYDQTWRYNFGFQASGMTENWKYDILDYPAMSGITYDQIHFERSFSYTLLYADVDYKIEVFKNLNFYLGAGLGINSLISKIKQSYEPQSTADSPNEKDYNYVVLAIRLKAGFDYSLSDHFTVLLDFTPIIQPEYETVDEYPQDDAYLDFKEVLYPETINGTMSVFSLGLTYYF
jgi:Curli production assembly/transport component CsgG